MIKLRDLQYLDAINTHRHFGKAAEACFVTQPTLSAQLAKLEEQLGLTLVERHKRGVMLTPEGESLCLEARKVLDAADHFEQSARSLSDPLAGEIHIGLIPTLAPYLLPHIMVPLSEELTKLDFFLHEDRTRELIHKLHQGKLDLLILPWLDEFNGVEAYDLFDEALCLAVPKQHELAQKSSVKLEQLDGLKVLTLEDGHCLRDQALGYCFTAGAQEDQRFQATSLETLRYMVAAGAGITLLPELAVEGRDDAQLSYVPFQKPAPSRRIVLLIRPNYPRMEAVRAVVANIRRQMKS